MHRSLILAKRNRFAVEPLSLRQQRKDCDGQIQQEQRRESGNDTLDKIAKAAMSREMLAAGLTAAAAAIAASPAARRKIRDAGLDAADSAGCRDTMMNSASKLGSLIAEAVADAAQRVMSGKWPTMILSSSRPASTRRAPAKRRQPAQDRRAAATKAATAKSATRQAARQSPRRAAAPRRANVLRPSQAGRQPTERWR